MNLNKYAPWMALSLCVLLLFSLVAFEAKEYSYSPPAAQNITSRAYTTGFRPNRQRDCIVGYSIVITTSSTLLAAAGGNVTLQMSPDSTTWTTIMTAERSFPSGLAIPGSTGSVTVFGLIKAGNWCRIINAQAPANATFSTPAGTELSF